MKRLLLFLGMVLVLSSFVSAGQEILLINQPNSNTGQSISPGSCRGQTVTFTGNTEIIKFALEIDSGAASEKNMTVSIWNISGSSLDTKLTTSDLLTITSVTATYDKYNLTFGNGYNISAGTYLISFDKLDASGYGVNRYNTNGNLYTGGSYVYGAGDCANGISISSYTQDYTFAVYSYLDNTCTYASSPWLMTASDQCTVSTANDMGGNAYTLTGTGQSTDTATFTAAQTNIGQITVNGASLIVKGTGLVVNG